MALSKKSGLFSSCNQGVPRWPIIARTHGCVRNDSETHETVLLDCFYHIHNVYKRNWDGPCLMNLTQNSYSQLHIFQIGNLFHCVVDSWWNMPFKGTRHGNGVADGAVAKRLLLWQHASALWRHAVWIRIVTSHNLWMGYEYSLQNMNRPRAIHKHDPHPLETMGRVWLHSIGQAIHAWPRDVSPRAPIQFLNRWSWFVCIFKEFASKLLSQSPITSIPNQLARWLLTQSTTLFPCHCIAACP